MKKAYLVTFAPCTRVVVEENATEDDIILAAAQKIQLNPSSYIDMANCLECVEDTAVPYNAYNDEGEARQPILDHASCIWERKLNNDNSTNTEPDQPILFHPLDIPAPPGGRGFFGAEKGERITDINQIKRGDILLKYSPQFNANNVVKVIGERVSPILRLALVFWNPIKNVSMGEPFSLAGYSLYDPGADEFYKPAVKEKAEA